MPVRDDPAGEEQRLLRSWAHNADAWTEAVRGGHIESRRVATDAVVIDTVLTTGATRVLDVGCGEGWLARSLTGRGLDVTGFDGSAGLIQRARAAGGGSYTHLTYDEFVREPSLAGGRYDAAVCNFSLLGEHIETVLTALQPVLRPDGTLIVQTLHPETVDGGGVEEGWREESFAALSAVHFTPMPWYFRTAESWRAVLVRAGWRVASVREPRHPGTGSLLSLVLIATLR